MDSTTARPTARLIAAHRAVSSCVRAYIVRDTTGCLPLPAAQRFNHFPAAAFCSITWVLSGQVHRVDLHDDRPALGAPLGPVVFGGPQTTPFVSYNPGAVHAFKVLLFPPALRALARIDVARFADRMLPLDQVLDAPWLGMAQQVLEARDDEQRIRLIEAFLAPRWREAREHGDTPGHLPGDWAQALWMHAANGSWGQSARNLERRFKAWAGQPLRRLRRVYRAQRAFVRNRNEASSGEVNWAELALRGGYSDQAHMCRDMRELSGLSPAELLRRARNDEAYWIYRIWGDLQDDPAGDELRP